MQITQMLSVLAGHLKKMGRKKLAWTDVLLFKSYLLSISCVSSAWYTFHSFVNVGFLILS